MIRRRLLVAGLAAVAIVSAAALGQAKDDASMTELRRKLMFAQRERQIAAALDGLSARIGKQPGFKDAGALGDWLKALPSGRNRWPLVLQRIGWAYVAVQRGPEAIEPLEAALKDNPGSGPTRAYLGEALRQAGRELEGLKMMAVALRLRYDSAHLKESIMEAAANLRRSGQAKDADGLPHYAEGIRDVLMAKADPSLSATLARWLLWDLAAFDKPGTERGSLWAKTAAAQTLVALDTTSELIAGSQQLAFDAALAIEGADEEAMGDTERFDLLVHAVRLGEALAAGGVHLMPQAYTHLAEAAAAEGRYALAWRLATKRMDISYSPRAARLMRTLPPDLGD